MAKSGLCAALLALVVAVACGHLLLSQTHFDASSRGGSAIAAGAWGAAWRQALQPIAQLWPQQASQLQADHHASPARADNATCNCKAASSDAAACQLAGAVRECCCDYASVEQVNRDSVNPLLKRLVQTPFMRYFKVTLWCECPFWPDDGMCALRDCSVCECADEEVPKLWKDAEAASCLSGPETAAASVETVDDRTRSRLVSVRGWRGFNNPWMPVDEEEVDYSYVNLQQNVERYTGYKGEAAHRIWDAIYTQSCFTNIHDNDTCTERRIFYRLISGMHASISAHIANDYLLDEVSGRWGPNLVEFQRRLGNPDVKARVENLYFAYLFSLRAVQKAAPLLERLEYRSGCSNDDSETARLVSQLVNSEALQKACPIPFHEGRLWQGEDADALRAQLQTHFRNMTRIMDCVGCEKCKLWGKLQLMGIATSLKILFNSSDDNGIRRENGLVLERNEVVALLNLLERFSTSIEIVRAMSLELLKGGDTSLHSALGAIETVTESTPLFSQFVS